MCRKYRAYLLVLRLIFSYKWASFRTRFMSSERGLAHMDALHRKNAQRLCALFMELKGLYIKLGQLISILAAALPSVFREAFTELQSGDRLPRSCSPPLIQPPWLRPPLGRYTAPVSRRGRRWW